MRAEDAAIERAHLGGPCTRKASPGLRSSAATSAV
jgi:hypothetical protein